MTSCLALGYWERDTFSTGNLQSFFFFFHFQFSQLVSLSFAFFFYVTLRISVQNRKEKRLELGKTLK